MFEICAFANIRRAPRTVWTVLLSKKVGTAIDYTIYELIAGVRPNGLDVYSVRVADVTGAGGVADSTEFADKFDALDAYNVVAGNIVAAN